MYNQILKANRSIVMVKRFQKKYWSERKLTPKMAIEGLRKASYELSKNYWNQYRLAIIHAFQTVNNHKAAEAVRIFDYQECRKAAPVSDLKKEKSPPCKKVSEAEHKLIIDRLMQAKKTNIPLRAVIELIRETGVRPCEVSRMRFNMDKNSIFVTGAKKTEDGKRGLDRELLFDSRTFEVLNHAHLVWKEYKASHPEKTDMAAMKLLQNKFATLTKKIWPRRKCRITLKSYRHQMGSNLKASGESRVVTAAIMGHQSVDSLTCYGNAKSSTRTLNVKVTQESINRVRKTELKECPQKIHREYEAKRQKAKVKLL